MRVLVCGGRTWTDQEPIVRELTALPNPPHVVIEGGAPGADACAFFAAVQQGWQVETYEADWPQYGKRAGPIRNRRMLTEG